MNIFNLCRGVYYLFRREVGLDAVHGVSLSLDLKRLVPAFHAQVVFDVGANRGQTAVEFNSNFPGAKIHCFEPIHSAFTKLVERTKHMPNVECHNLAFGSVSGRARMATYGKSELSFLLTEDQASTVPLAQVEEVDVQTIDVFCQQTQLRHLDLLKIDAEGHDMEVLRGAEKLLDEMRVDVVQVEAGIDPRNERQVPLEDFRDFLEPRSYSLFGFYEQVHAWPDQKPNLRRVNAVFISKRLVDATTTV